MNRIALALVAIALLTLFGCPEVEEPVVTPEPTPVEDPAIVGDWVSEGEDVSPLLATFFNITRIDATFASDGSYEVVSTDGDGAEVNYVGTYTVDLTTVPHGITLAQTTPTAATSEGIWEVDGGVMTYEVVQTDPDIGFAAPTPEGDFGSTTGTGLNEGDNVQVFR